MDESGNTGENLLDPTQPYFTLAGIYISSSKAQRLVDAIGETLPPNSGEPKFSTLARKSQRLERLLDLLNELPISSIATYVFHKKFMLVSKIVDYLIVELFHDMGYNMYQDGSAKDLANLLFHIGPNIGNELLYERMVSAFSETVRGRGDQSSNSLFEAIDDWLDSCDPQYLEFIGWLRECRPQANRMIAYISSIEDKSTLDPAIPAYVMICSEFGKRIEKFDVVHDSSKIMHSQSEILMRMSELPDLVNPGESLSDLPVNSMTFASSHLEPGLQIADWIAGLTRLWADHARDESPDALTLRLKEIVEPWLFGTVWPDLESIGIHR